MKTETENKQDKANKTGAVRDCPDSTGYAAFKAGLSAAKFVAIWSFQNVFFIDRDGGPISYEISLICLLTLPMCVLVAFAGEFLLTLDDRFSA